MRSFVRRFARGLRRHETDRVRKQWDALGAKDPYWAVLTIPDRKGRWDREAFFRTGVDEIDSVEERLAKFGVHIARDVALDYGCGVGRLSRALADRFAHVIAVDISETMLVEARAANRDHTNIDFVRGSGDALASVADSSVDFVYSNIALQHSPPDTQRALLQEFCRVLRPGGAIALQIPSHANLRTVSGALHAMLGNRVLNIMRRVRYGSDGVMELHALERAKVERLLRACGMTIVHVERFDSAGPAFVSFRYFAAKPSPASSQRSAV